MFTLYADESGQQQDEERMFVAGYMGNDDAWKKLPGLWKQAIYPRHHLHLNRVRFKRDSEKQMLEKAGLVPKACGLTPVLGGIKVKGYRHLGEELRLSALYADMHSVSTQWLTTHCGWYRPTKG